LTQVPEVEILHDKPITLTMLLRPASTTCPISGCPYSVQTHSPYIIVQRFERHFFFRHAARPIQFIDPTSRYQRKPTIQCPFCSKSLCNITSQHLSSSECRTFTLHRLKRQQCRRSLEQLRSVKFTISGQPIDTVNEFLYLGRIISHDDSDQAAVLHRLSKARSTWHDIQRVIGRVNTEWTIPKTRFYKTIIQAKLLYGASTWVLTPTSLQRLNSFHHRCIRQIAQRYIHPNPDGTWTHPPTKDILDQLSLQPMSSYLAQRRARLLDYAKAESDLYKICCALPPSQSRQCNWWTPLASDSARYV
jgi:hypothetical protein